MIRRYSRREIERIREACEVVVKVLQKLKGFIKEGITTYELEVLAREETKRLGAVPAFLNYKPSFSKNSYPFALCVSVNSVVVHGMPSKEYRIKEGDLISLDFGVRKGNFCGDGALTVFVGKEPPEDVKRLMEATKTALKRAVKVIRPGARLSDITRVINETAEEFGVYAVRNLGGHGIGRRVHEEPFIPNNLKDLEKDVKLKRGMVLAIEPMFSLGTEEVIDGKDGWSIVTKDNSLSAHYEYTVAVVKEGCEVLTEFKDG